MDMHPVVTKVLTLKATNPDGMAIRYTRFGIIDIPVTGQISMAATMIHIGARTGAPVYIRMMDIWDLVIAGIHIFP